uniref:Si:ch211-79k12.1 n=1 Tax=Mastacembelus armatus TaxID=205130 RepID=A0A7N8YL54_9TELE
MKVLLVFAFHLCPHAATLLIKGPTQPVLEGEAVTLECRYSDSEHNISQVRFEVFSKYMQGWRQLYERWCFYSLEIEQTADSLILSIPRVGKFFEGPYRCVSDSENVTAPDNASEPLTFKVQCEYMGDVILSREGYTSFLGVHQELKVQPGDDVVLRCSASSSEEPSYSWNKDGSEWKLLSSKLTLKKVSAMDEGLYTCMANHSVQSLSKKRTISITVLPEDAAWYESTNGRFILMTLAVAVVLLVFIVSMTVFLCNRAKQTKTCKGPIDDRSQKKPIYKASVESLPSTSGDKEPLV